MILAEHDKIVKRIGSRIAGNERNRSLFLFERRIMRAANIKPKKDTITIRLDVETSKQLNELAEFIQVDRSTVIRRLINIAYDGKQSDKTKQTN